VWLLTLECVGVLEVAAGSELELALTGWLVLVAGALAPVAGDDAAVVEAVSEARAAADGRWRTRTAGRARCATA
jgi:hypothetical protein